MVQVEELKTGEKYAIKDVKEALRNFKDVRRFGIDRGDCGQSRSSTVTIEELLPDREFKCRDMMNEGWDGTINFDQMNDSEGCCFSKKFEYMRTESFFANSPIFRYIGKTHGY
jgi:hypothetical protein